MTTKITLEFNGEEITAPLEEWERLCSELMQLFHRQTVIQPPPLLDEPFKHLYDPYKITYGPGCGTGQPVFDLLPKTSGEM